MVENKRMGKYRMDEYIEMKDKIEFKEILYLNCVDDVLLSVLVNE